MALKKRRKRSKSLGNKRRRRKSIKLKRKFSKRKTIKRRRRKQKGGNWLTDLFAGKKDNLATLPQSSNTNNKGFFSGMQKNIKGLQTTVTEAAAAAADTVKQLPATIPYTGDASNKTGKDLLKDLKAKLKQLTVALSDAERVLEQAEAKSDALCKMNTGSGKMELPALGAASGAALGAAPGAAPGAASAPPAPAAPTMPLLRN